MSPAAVIAPARAPGVDGERVVTPHPHARTAPPSGRTLAYRRVMTTTAKPGEPTRSLLERGLGLIAEVRPGEGRSALLLMLNVFLLLAGYYFLKSAREGLILGAPPIHLFGLEIQPAEVKTYASAGQAALL